MIDYTIEDLKDPTKLMDKILKSQQVRELDPEMRMQLNVFIQNIKKNWNNKDLNGDQKIKANSKDLEKFTAKIKSNVATGKK